MRLNDQEERPRAQTAKRKLFIGLAAVLLLLVAVIATRPAAFRLERRATIAAPAPVVFAELSDFRRWQGWSPWEKMDPNIQRTYSGAESGVGAIYSWKGSGGVGEGSMTITDSTPSERLALTLEFRAPLVATNAVEFTLTPGPNGVVVSWSMAGQNGFIGKAITMFVSMDAMVGSQFEQGLADLKALAEAKA